MDRFIQLQKTCDACPAQWSGVLKSGRHIYIRYRWGNLGIGIGDSRVDAVNNYTYGVDIGDGYDGELSTEKMLEHLKYLENPELVEGE